MVANSIQLVCLTLAQVASTAAPGELQTGPRPPVAAQATQADPFSPFRQPPANPARAGGRPLTVDAAAQGQANGGVRARPGRLEPGNDSAHSLIKSTLCEPADVGLEGEEVSLLQVLRQNLDPLSRVRAIESYWLLAAKVGEYHFAWDEEQRLAEVPPPRSALDEALLAAAAAAAAARRQTAKVELLDRQHTLAEDARLPLLGAPPWPQDAPLVGAYHTQFEKLFNGRPQPLRLRRIDRVLPHLLDRINARADAVSSAQRAFQVGLQSYRNGACSLETLLDIHRQLSQQRSKFLTAVLEYNTRIAEYVTSALSPTPPPEILVSTMIDTTGRASRSAVADSHEGRVAPASAIQALSDEPGRVAPANLEAEPSAARSAPPAKLAPPRPSEPRRFQPDASVLKRISRIGDRSADPPAAADDPPIRR